MLTNRNIFYMNPSLKPVLTALFALFVFTLPSSRAQEMSIGTAEYPSVHFENIKDGDVVKSPFAVKFSVRVFKAVPAGQIVPKTGHHHLIVDGKPIPKGSVVPKDAKHLHFGKGESETVLSLKPGKHTLTLQFADGAHISYGEEVSTTIKIRVKK